MLKDYDGNSSLALITHNIFVDTAKNGPVHVAPAVFLLVCTASTINKRCNELRFASLEDMQDAAADKMHFLRRKLLRPV